MFFVPLLPASTHLHQDRRPKSDSHADQVLLYGNHHDICFVIPQIFIFDKLKLVVNNGRTDDQHHRKGELKDNQNFSKTDAFSPDFQRPFKRPGRFKGGQKKSRITAGKNTGDQRDPDYTDNHLWVSGRSKG